MRAVVGVEEYVAFAGASQVADGDDVPAVGALAAEVLGGAAGGWLVVCGQQDCQGRSGAVGADVDEQGLAGWAGADVSDGGVEDDPAAGADVAGGDGAGGAQDVGDGACASGETDLAVWGQGAGFELVCEEVQGCGLGAGSAGRVAGGRVLGAAVSWPGRAGGRRSWGLGSGGAGLGLEQVEDDFAAACALASFGLAGFGGVVGVDVVGQVAVGDVLDAFESDGEVRSDLGGVLGAERQDGVAGVVVGVPAGAQGRWPGGEPAEFPVGDDPDSLDAGVAHGGSPFLEHGGGSVVASVERGGLSTVASVGCDGRSVIAPVGTAGWARLSPSRLGFRSARSRWSGGFGLLPLGRGEGALVAPSHPYCLSWVVSAHRRGAAVSPVPSMELASGGEVLVLPGEGVLL